jgi:HNH endonuclease
MSEPVPAALRDFLRGRAGFRREYCLFHEDDCTYPHEIDHIISRKHRGETEEDNLAWACFVCNRLKGSDIASIDLETGKLARLFHPRNDRWNKHFRLEGPRIVPLTNIGRVTEHLLQLNHPDNVQLRKDLQAKELFPR